MKRKPMYLICVWVCICLFITGCADSFLINMEEIEEYVNNNISTLEIILEDTIPAPPWSEEHKDYIEKQLSNDTIVRQINRWDNGVVMFYCDGHGLSVGDTTVGFYYSPDDQPFAFEFNSHILQEIAEDTYSWESDNGLRSFFTKRISTNWFYYKQVWQ